MKPMLVGARGLVGQRVLQQALASPAVGWWFAGVLQPLLPPRYRAVAVDAVARTLLAAASAQAPGVHVIQSERIT